MLRRPHTFTRDARSRQASPRFRNVGAEEYTDIALRNAINAGKIPGPRILCSAVALGSTGGHADLNGFSPYLHFQEVAPGIANGVEQIRELIRRNIKYGADWTKFWPAAMSFPKKNRSVCRNILSSNESGGGEAALWEADASHTGRDHERGGSDRLENKSRASRAGLLRRSGGSKTRVV
jgi:hypothetical protein